MSFVQFFQYLLGSPKSRDLALELLAVYGLRPVTVPVTEVRRSA
jgi:hypothetical protein